MQTWNNTDKSKYPARGPWDTEPDKAQFVAHGLDCLIVRGPLGALCGYVGVPPSHPWFEKNYSGCVAPERHDSHEGGEDSYHYNCTPQGIVTVHGGLTFSDRCSPEADPARGICHTEEGAANKTVFWFGFDCGHCDDLIPNMGCRYTWPVRYRDFAYVKGEVESLAEQLAAVVTTQAEASCSA